MDHGLEPEYGHLVRRQHPQESVWGQGCTEIKRKQDVASWHWSNSQGAQRVLALNCPEVRAP
eukprot:3838312-Rhodomonas_salina.1